MPRATLSTYSLSPDILLFLNNSSKQAMDVPLSPGGMVLLCALCWVIWKYFRQVFTNSPLDSIPGPPSASFLYGELLSLKLLGWILASYSYLRKSRPATRQEGLGFSTVPHRLVQWCRQIAWASPCTSLPIVLVQLTDVGCLGSSTACSTSVIPLRCTMSS